MEVVFENKEQNKVFSPLQFCAATTTPQLCLLLFVSSRTRGPYLEEWRERMAHWQIIKKCLGWRRKCNLNLHAKPSTHSTGT